MDPHALDDALWEQRYDSDAWVSVFTPEERDRLVAAARATRSQPGLAGKTTANPPARTKRTPKA